MANEKRLIDPNMKIIDKHFNKRLIDANEVERKFRLCISSWHRDCNSNAPVIARAFEDALQRVIYAPTVDAVEVVRCKDCKHWRDGVAGCTDAVKLCDIGYYMIGKDGFCSFGERKDNV